MSNDGEFLLRSRRVLGPDGLGPAAIHVKGNEVARIHGYDAAPEDLPVDDVGDAVVMPGVVDAHVHLNDPGRAHWEGFETGTRAAAGGGVTTVVDMPLNSIPSTTDAQALEAKLEAADGRLYVDVGFWGGVVPGNAGELAELWEAGVLGFKCFRVPSGVDEFEYVRREDLEEAMPVLAELGAPLLTHAELPGPIDEAESVWEGANRRDYGTYVASRPPEAELEAIEEMIALAEAYDTPVHIVHLAASQALEAIGEAQQRGVAVTVETCAHYLNFAGHAIEDGRTDFKCAPPIRGREHRELLRAAALDGRLDFVTTDHSPSPPELKCLDSGNFKEAWGGIASLQLLLPATWTALREETGETAGLERLGELLCERPAEFAGITGRKGTLEPGSDADFVVWRPEEAFTVDGTALHHKHPVTPYDGRELYGVVDATYLRGSRISEAGDVEGAPMGSSVLRP